MNQGADMDGVGRQIIDAYRREATHGDADRYALRRLSMLIDELAELPDAQSLLSRAYHRVLEVEARRRKMAVVE